MSTLDDLFDDADGRLDPTPELDAGELNRLRAIVGAGPATAGRRAPGSAATAARLAEIVGDAEPTSEAPSSRLSGSGSPSSAAVQARRGRLKTRRRTAGDWISAAVAVAAIAAIVVVGGLVVVERTTSDEVSQAAQSLREQVAELRNRTTTLETSLSLYGTAVADATGLAEQAEPALTGLEGRSDEGARTAALQALAGFRDALAQHETTEEVTEPVSRSSAPTDLASVAAQIDEVRVVALDVDEAIERTREARSALAATRAGFLAALSTFGASLPVAASAIADENADAPEAYRTAVLAAADEVIGAQRTGESGAEQMAAYGQAVDALRAENQRVLDARVPQPRNDGGWVPPPWTATPTAPADPGTEPPTDGATDPGTDPVIPIDPTPIDPTPIDPAPTPVPNP